MDNLATQLKDQEIQAAALAEEHRLAMEKLEKAQPVKVVRDEKEVHKLKTELTQMSKRAERYRTERDTHKTNLDAMEKRAERYRKERKVADDKNKDLERRLAGTEKSLSAAESKALSAAFGGPSTRSLTGGMASVFTEPASPSTPTTVEPTSAKGQNAEVWSLV